MSEISLTHRAPGELKPRARAFRTHPEAQIKALCASLKTYGFVESPLIDRNNNIICGTAVVLAAKRLGYNRIPVTVVEHLDEAQLRAYAIAANKLADLAGYDEAELALELRAIQELIGGVQMPEMGIVTPELDRLLGLTGTTLTDPDASIALNQSAVVSRAGDLWTMGRHRLLVGDALQGTSFAALMGEERAQAILCDLPYNRPTSTSPPPAGSPTSSRAPAR